MTYICKTFTCRSQIKHNALPTHETIMDDLRCVFALLDPVTDQICRTVATNQKWQDLLQLHRNSLRQTSGRRLEVQGNLTPIQKAASKMISDFLGPPETRPYVRSDRCDPWVAHMHTEKLLSEHRPAYRRTGGLSLPQCLCSYNCCKT